MSDSMLRCAACGAEQRVSLLDCLRNGWPRCSCGKPGASTTMTLAETDADVGSAIGSLMEEHGLSAAANQVGRSHG